MIDENCDLALSERPSLKNSVAEPLVELNCGFDSELIEVGSGNTESNCSIYFLGSISSYKELRRNLNLETVEMTDVQLVKAAYLKFGAAIKNYLVGDFSLVIVDCKKQICLVWRHQLSSHPLFLSEKDNKLLIGQRLDSFQKQGFSELDASALTELLHWGVITGNLTLFKDVSQLEVGEFQTWKLNQKLKLVERSVGSIFAEYAPTDSELYRLADVNYQVPTNIKSSEAYKLLPELAIRQDFPVTCQNQIESYHFLRDCAERKVICDLGLSLWGRAHTYRYSDAPAELEVKRLYMSQWARGKRPLAYLVERKTQLEKLQQSRGEHSECWRTWIKLRYWLPSMQGLVRNQANSLGKQIIFLVNQPFYRKFGDLEPEITFSNKCNIWKLDDEPIFNLFENMQRLFAFGTRSVSKKIFHFAPPMTGSLVKRFYDKAEFQEFCMTCITLDYLSRFNHWTIE